MYPLRLRRQLDGLLFIGRHHDHSTEWIEARPADGGETELLHPDPDEAEQRDIWIDEHGWRYLFEGIRLNPRS